MMPDNTNKSRTKIWLIATLVFVSSDLISAGWGLNPGIRTDFYDVEKDKTQVGRLWMPQDVEYNLKFNRFFQFETFKPEASWEDMHDVFLPNLPIMQRIELVNNFDPLVPGYYQSWMDEINVYYPNDQVIEMMNISDVINWDGIGAIELSPAGKQYQPVKVVGCMDVVSPMDQTPSSILNSKTDILKNIIVTSDEPVQCDPNGNGSVEIVDQRNGYVNLQVDLDEDSWIFWSQTWYPSWVYRIDGSEAQPSYRVNYLFQGVPAPSGSQQVELIYRPLSVFWGGLISSISLFVFGGLVVWGNRKINLRSSASGIDL
jgi:hypothetical protein